jgi:hypothetical protein
MSEDQAAHRAAVEAGFADLSEYIEKYSTGVKPFMRELSTNPATFAAQLEEARRFEGAKLEAKMEGKVWVGSAQDDVAHRAAVEAAEHAADDGTRYYNELARVNNLHQSLSDGIRIGLMLLVLGFTCLVIALYT